MANKNRNNKKPKSKSVQNASYAGMPKINLNAGSVKPVTHKQEQNDSMSHDS